MADVKTNVKTALKGLSIKDLITFITVVVPLLKALFEVVKEFEIPGATGEEKKAAAMGFLDKIVDKILANNPALAGFKEMIMDFFDSAIDAAVWAYNKVKKFQHMEPK